ncbi:MAG: hypothetical protein SFX74_09485 [Fimbriimonadaceae bacterium]|nr:hypothetical protein [Fimbriimonadaceae bacterium]
MGKAVSGVVKWLVVPLALAYVGYAFIGPNVGGKLKKAAGKLNLNPNLNVIPGAAQSLTPDIKVRPVEDADDEAENRPTGRNATKGPEVEVSVRENVVIASNRSRASNGPRVEPAPAADEKPKPRRRRRRAKPKPKVAESTATDAAPAPSAPANPPDDGGSGGSVGGIEPPSG